MSRHFLPLRPLSSTPEIHMMPFSRRARVHEYHPSNSRSQNRSAAFIMSRFRWRNISYPPGKRTTEQSTATKDYEPYSTCCRCFTNSIRVKECRKRGITTFPVVLANRRCRWVNNDFLYANTAYLSASLSGCGSLFTSSIVGSFWGIVCIGTFGNPNASRCNCSYSSKTSSSSSFVIRVASNFDTSCNVNTMFDRRQDLLISYRISCIVHELLNWFKRHFFINFLEHSGSLL